MKTDTPRLHRWLSAVLGLFLIAEVASRFVSLDVFAFRAWEVMLLGRGPTGPFAPSRTFSNPWSYGDLGNLVGRPDLRVFRADRFTTDEYGFRNPPRVQRDHLPVAAILNGDSYSVGTGVPDEDALAAQLTTRLGGAVYNIAGRDPAALPDIVAISKRLNLGRRIVIQAYLDRWGSHPPGYDPALYATTPPTQITAQERLTRFWNDVSISRSKIFINRITKDWTDPPVAPTSANVKHFLDGREIVMLPKDMASSYGTVQGQQYFPWLHQQLAKEKIDLLVVLIPNKYTVYEPLLKEADPRRGQPGWHDQLESFLKQQKVPVINLTARFRQRAAQELRQGRTLYWIDDTHWNADGIRYAAEIISETLKQSTQR